MEWLKNLLAGWLDLEGMQKRLEEVDKQGRRTALNADILGGEVEDATFSVASQIEELKEHVAALEMGWDGLSEEIRQAQNATEFLREEVKLLRADLAQFKNLSEFGPGGRIPNDF